MKGTFKKILGITGSMKIIIPMAGKNESFPEEDMDEVKHLIKIDGRSMIEHICSMFPKNSEFIFLCRKEHLEGSGLKDHLKKIVKNAEVISVGRDTRGPLETTLLAEGHVDDSEEIVIVHSDAFSVWNFDSFLSKIRERSPDGAMSTYRGFHPTYLTSVKYASIFVNDNDFVSEIKEKETISKGYIENYTSAGSYYFSSWGLFRKYARKYMESSPGFGGVFYISLVYNEMIKDGLRVVPFEVEDLVYWGTPANLKEYIFWSEYFSHLTEQGEERPVYDMITLVPAAGRGKRFVDAGYTVPKPLINVLGEPMLVKCAKSLPKTTEYVFVCLKDHIKKYYLDYILKKNFPGCEITALDSYTDGMARSCLMAEHLLDKKRPVIVSSCDYSFVYNDRKLRNLIEEEEPDVIIWTFRDYPDARVAPHAYAYIVVDGNRVRRVSEKVPISSEPHKDYIVQGTFYFKNAKLLIDCINEMIEKKIAVNGEYYVGTAVNQLIEKGMKVVLFDLDKYICWGTPADLMVFEYWERYFDRDPTHPYKIKRHGVYLEA